MNAITTGASAPSVFTFDSHSVRTVLIDDQPWFVAADVCAALEMGNVTMALKRLDDDEQALSSIEGISRGNDQANIINESGLYNLVLGSRKSEAKRFKKWVTSEVLPAIRKTGRYEAAPAAPIGDALKASIAEAVKQALAAQLLPAPAQLPAMKMSIDPRRLIDLMTDLRKIYARLDALGMVASDLPPKWWDQHAVHGIGEPWSRG